MGGDKSQREAVEAFINLASNGVLDRIDQRGKRARELHQWSLHPHHAEPESPLAGDNAAFAAAYPLTLAGDAAVTQESLFPMMNASENLNAAGFLTEQRRADGTLFASSVMQLCRSAMENSARTIWLLSAPEREVRRDRCLSFVMEQLKQQSQFLKIDEEGEASGRNPRPAQMVAMNREHRRKHAELLRTLHETYTFAKPPAFGKTITLAAQWVDTHIPAHDTGELADLGLEDGARTFYSYGSSFVHGYFWMKDYARNGRLFGMIADSLAAAVNMTECAVALYEAACRGAPDSNPDTPSHVPERLEPTIEQWARHLYQA